jgi:hypothetical protein
MAQVYCSGARKSVKKDLAIFLVVLNSTNARVAKKPSVAGLMAKTEASRTEICRPPRAS